MKIMKMVMITQSVICETPRLNEQGTSSIGNGRI